mgnify:CR=1 FL=1|tara:strand:- start:1396 stop:2070 length:675 start_codon:yes stop_codon:yes gene_type:complete
MTTIGEAISRLRGSLKATSQDAFITDRYLYSLILKYAQMLMRRQDHANKLMKFSAIWQTLPHVELIEVDKLEAGCTGLTSGHTIKRSKHKLPTFMQGYWGPLVRTVSSLDGSVEIQPTSPGSYVSMAKTTTFKYNNTKYYWFVDGYLYFPNIDWDGIKLEGVFEGDTSTWTCAEEDDCVPRYLQKLYVPEFLFAEIENQILNVQFNSLKVTPEDSHNKININRQ